MGELFRLRAYDEVASTNEIVKRAIEAGEPEGLAVCARAQVAGYGRQGRTWSSPEGGVYLSLLLRPRCDIAQLPTLSLVAGIAVRRAIGSFAHVGAADRVRLKWPNDVVLEEPHDGMDPGLRKIAGISLESHAGGICVGVGVNVVAPDHVGRSLGKYEPAYVEELAGDVTVAVVRDAVLASFAACYECWLEGGFAMFSDEYREHAALFGCSVAVENVDGSLVAQGTVEGIDGSGRLVVSPVGSAEVLHLSSGEVHLARVGS